MKLIMDSALKRRIFIILITIIDIFLLFMAFYLKPNWVQSSIVVYLILIQLIVYITFNQFKNQHAFRFKSIKKLKNPRLQENAFKLAEMLLKEFDYTRETAAQAMNDRHTLMNYFLIITGAVIALVANIFGRGSSDSLLYKKEILIFTALIFNFIGWIYFLQIIRLRQAWCGSAQAMNQIKNFFISNCRVPDDIARSAFLWDAETLPKPGKKSNVFYYSAVLISFVSSIAIMLASLVLLPSEYVRPYFYFSAALSLYHFLFQVIMYSVFLDYKSR